MFLKGFIRSILEYYADSGKFSLPPHLPFMLPLCLLHSSLLILTGFLSPSPGPPSPPPIPHSWFKPSCFDPVPKIFKMKTLLATYKTLCFIHFIPQPLYFPHSLSGLVFFFPPIAHVIWQTKYLLILFNVLFPPSECKLYEEFVYTLSIAIAPEPGIVSDIALNK